MLKPKNITLERVKQSKYWDLIGIMIWNHYSEFRYQRESMIEITLVKIYIKNFKI